MKYFTHPITTLILFSTILVNGENMGGPYIYYVILALPHGGPHALLAIAGAAFLIFSWVHYRGKEQYRLSLLLDTIGIWLLYLSLFIFFYRSWTYNNGTFAAAVPILSFVVFLVSSLGRLALDTACLTRPALP